MHYRIGNSLCVALALVGLIASGAHANARGARIAPRMHLRGEPFTVSGSCTGLFAGELRVDGTSYQLDPDAQIYEVGRGFVSLDTNLNYRIVSLTGVKVRNTMIVTSVLIRPDFNPTMGAGRSSPVGLKDASGPK
jgi:hypothetical protein